MGNVISESLNRTAQEPILIGGFIVGADQQFGIFQCHAAVRCNRMREPNIAANDAVVSDTGISAENGRPGVAGYAVFNVRMAFVAESAHQLTAGIALAGG